MLGMSSLSFLILTLIAAAVAVAYHNVIRYRFLEGYDAFIGKLIVGWLGAWLGSPVLGHWLPSHAKTKVLSLVPGGGKEIPTM